jgi:hypothetical protein
VCRPTFALASSRGLGRIDGSSRQCADLTVIDNHIALPEGVEQSRRVEAEAADPRRGLDREDEQAVVAGRLPAAVTEGGGQEAAHLLQQGLASLDLIHQRRHGAGAA